MDGDREKFLDGVPLPCSSELHIAIKEYLSWDQNATTRNYIKGLLDAADFEELDKLLLARLDFGTAGIRGRMGPGYCQLNDLVIIQTSQGLAEYLYGCFGHRELRDCVVIIGYDGRHNSYRFALLASRSMISKGFNVHLFRVCVPTPFVPYAVSLKNGICGIMITASHNPKEDNGYKVYWSNGAQIITPHDRRIQESILKNLMPWEAAWDTETLIMNTNDPSQEVQQKYFDDLKEDMIFPEINAQTPLLFTYTPMHGVGAKYIAKGFNAVGLKTPFPVPQQIEIDPEFPTVKFPNPEEGKSALKLAIETADSLGSTIIVANDPDADRLAVAEKQGDVWKIFNGNELGALLGWWALFVYKHKNGSDDLKNCYMLASTVSSKILQTFAEKEGFNFVETLTGFKWMGNKCIDLVDDNRKAKVLFAFEEAIGFMFGTRVLDKDGISAGVRLAELAAYLHSENMTLQQKLLSLYHEYGYHVSENSYFICRDPEIIREIFTKIRKFEGEDQTYPSELMGGKYKIVSVRDLTYGYDSTRPPSYRPILPVSRSSQMVTFEIEGDGDCRVVATLRTSGTEPKIKYYSELIASPNAADWKALDETLKEIVNALVTEHLQPAKYGLEPRSD